MNIQTANILVINMNKILLLNSSDTYKYFNKNILQEFEKLFKGLKPTFLCYNLFTDTCILLSWCTTPGRVLPIKILLTEGCC